jgi:hypothetical protein
MDALRPPTGYRPPASRPLTIRRPAPRGDALAAAWLGLAIFIGLLIPLVALMVVPVDPIAPAPTRPTAAPASAPAGGQSVFPRAVVQEWIGQQVARRGLPLQNESVQLIAPDRVVVIGRTTGAASSLVRLDLQLGLTEEGRPLVAASSTDRALAPWADDLTRGLTTQLQAAGPLRRLTVQGDSLVVEPRA